MYVAKYFFTYILSKSKQLKIKWELLPVHAEIKTM